MKVYDHSSRILKSNRTKSHLDIVNQWSGRSKLDSGTSVRKAAEPILTYGGKNGGPGKCFLVPVDEIRANKYDLSISRYKQIEHKEVEYEKPEAIMLKVMELEKEIAKDLEAINSLL